MLSDSPQLDLQHSNRRTFLKQSAGTLAMVAAASGLGLSKFGLSEASAIEPIKRNGTPKFKFSLAAYSYRNFLSGKSPELTLDDFIKDCAKLQLDGTELTSYYFPKEITTDYLNHLRQLSFTLGLDISGTAIRDDLCFPKGEKRDQEIAHVKQWIEYAQQMNAPVIRIFSGNARKGQSVEEAHRLAVEGMEECCEYAGKHGVYLALENHGGLTETVDGMLKLINDVKSPWFGVNLDSGNFHGEMLYEDLAKIAPYAINAQIKVVVRKQGKQKEPSDFKRLAKILKDAGYRGYIVLEYEESEDPKTMCAKYMDQLQEAFQI